mmetsp:Transcript_70724/g.229079  ORF Transcript_70724/g.229079 Transcript_70724/m.229079 type:complete len:659 (+) Transcript_70724:61-2037(+)
MAPAGAAALERATWLKLEVLAVLATACAGGILALRGCARIQVAGFAIKPLHASWLVPLLCLIVAHFALGAPEEGDVVCDESNWSPMVPLVAQLYMPFLGDGLAIRRKLMDLFGPLMYLNFLGRALPKQRMPTMARVLSPEELHERLWFFIPNMVMAVVLDLAFLEACKAFSDRYPTIRAKAVSCWRALRERREPEPAVEGKNDLVTPLVRPDAPAKPSEKPQQEEGKGEGEEEDVPSLRREKKVRRSYAVAFVVFYVFYQTMLYVWVDTMVAGGLMNFNSGIPWEEWCIALLFELTTHAVVTVCVYAARPGAPYQSPTFLVFPVLLPWIGNAVHIFKDHTTQGLSFAMGHCATGSLRYVGVVLGLLGFAATIHPLVPLLRSEECREGLRMSHWPVAEAGPPSGSGGDAWAAAKAKAMSSMICACTAEKRVRAIHGEVPHTVLHMIFVFFFGGSHFIFFSIFISVLKILSIPVFRDIIIPTYILDWGCSADSARKYLVNGMGDPEKIFHLAKRRHWTFVLEEFWPAAAGGVLIPAQRVWDTQWNPPGVPELECAGLGTVYGDAFRGPDDEYRFVAAGPGGALALQRLPKGGGDPVEVFSSVSWTAMNDQGLHFEGDDSYGTLIKGKALPPGDGDVELSGTRKPTTEEAVAWLARNFGRA